MNTECRGRRGVSGRDAGRGLAAQRRAPASRWSTRRILNRLGSLGPLVAVLVGWSGCYAPIVARPPEHTVPRNLPRANELVARLELERVRVTGLRTLADSEISGPDGHVRASEVLVVVPPNRLRIEVLSMFGVAWIMATDGEVLHVYSRKNDAIFRGKPTPGLLREYLPLPLSLEELTELLLGRPPRRQGSVAAEVAWEPETRLVRLVSRLANGGTETIWFGADSGLLMRCEERTADGSLRFDLRISAYRYVGSKPMSASLTIIGPNGVKVHLAYARSEINPTLPPSIFRLPVIAGTHEATFGFER